MIISGLLMEIRYKIGFHCFYLLVVSGIGTTSIFERNIMSAYIKPYIFEACL